MFCYFDGYCSNIVIILRSRASSSCAVAVVVVMGVSLCVYIFILSNFNACFLQFLQSNAVRKNYTTNRMDALAIQILFTMPLYHSFDSCSQHAHTIFNSQEPIIVHPSETNFMCETTTSTSSSSNGVHNRQIKFVPIIM